MRKLFPDFSPELIIVGTSMTSIEKGWVALGEVPLLAVIVPLNRPLCDGTPVITPAGLISSPVGSPGAVKVIGVVPSAVHVWE